MTHTAERSYTRSEWRAMQLARFEAEQQSVSLWRDTDHIRRVLEDVITFSGKGSTFTTSKVISADAISEDFDDAADQRMILGGLLKAAVTVGAIRAEGPDLWRALDHEILFDDKRFDRLVSSFKSEIGACSFIH